MTGKIVVFFLFKYTVLVHIWLPERVCAVLCGCGSPQPSNVTDGILINFWVVGVGGATKWCSKDSPVFDDQYIVESKCYKSIGKTLNCTFYIKSI